MHDPATPKRLDPATGTASKRLPGQRPWARTALFAALAWPSLAFAFSFLDDAPVVPGTVSDDRLPRVVAVLPFDNDTAEANIAEEVRRAFYNHFSSKPYSDIELLAVDAKLLAMSHASGADGAKPDYRALCRELGCDGVVTGRVTEFRKVYAGLYSELSVSATISLVAVAEGASLLDHADQVSYKDGGISLNPIGLAMTAFSAARNVSDLQRMRMVNELGQRLTQAVPDPQGAKTSPGPRIQELMSNAATSPFGLGKVVQVGIQGDPGALAVFDIGQARTGIAMRETTPGVYVGEYRVQEGDNLRQATIRVTLRARNGLQSQWLDPTPVSLDSVPPPPPEAIGVRSLPGQVELSWRQIKPAPDLAGYQVQRSSQPLSGYQSIARTEASRYADSATETGKPHYYRIVGIDAAGNESDPSPSVLGRVLATGVAPLRGPIVADLELAGGQYLIDDELRLDAGATLRLMPGSRLLFAPTGSLLVRGDLVADGSAEAVAFAPRGEHTWPGIRVEGGRLELKGFSIAGADTCLSLDQARARLGSGQIGACGTALAVRGEGAVEVRDLRIGNSKIGIRLNRTDADLSRNTIANNGLGVELTAFSGTFRDNSLLHNEVNLRAEAGTLLDANYWGSLDPAAMRIEGAQVREALSRPAPEGRVVAVRANPYANLSPEARLERVAESMIEAGRLFRAKNFGRAAALFEQALAVSPSPDAYYFAALSQNEMQEPARALDYLSEGVAAFPDDPALRRALGMLHYQRGEEAPAREHLRAALRLSPGDTMAAFVLKRLDETASADTASTNAVSTDPAAIAP